MVGWPRSKVAVKSQMHTGAWAFQRQRTIDSLVGSPSALSKPAASRALGRPSGIVISQHLPRSRTGSSTVATRPFYIDNYRWDCHTAHIDILLLIAMATSERRS